MAVLAYVQGLSEKVARIFKKRGVNTAMKPLTTLRRLLVSPKDKLDHEEGVYTIKCSNCEKTYWRH